MNVSGEVYECYDFGAFKELLKLAETAKVDKERVILRDYTIKELALKTDALDKVVSLQASTIALQKAENLRMYNLWVADNKRLYEVSTQTNWSAWLGWSTAGAFAVASAVLLGMSISD
jgi:hypothetical protein